MKFAGMLRLAVRLPLLAWIVISGILAWRPSHRVSWMQWMSRRFLRLLGARVEVAGEIPAAGLIVCNHLGYVDILVIGSVCPCTFVSKSDVQSWPVFGLLASLAGTVFVDRGARRGVPVQIDAIRERLETRGPVVLFPEGTSSGGEEVLPFRSTLFEAVRAGQVATPAAIGYDLPGGRVADEIAYWRDMVFLPHILNLLGKPGCVARLSFGISKPLAGDRKMIASQMHREVGLLLASLKQGCRA